MFQAILIDLADVFAGRSSPESLGLELELLIKRFLWYCVLSLDVCVINTLKSLLLSQPNFLSVVLELQAIIPYCLESCTRA